MPSIIILGVYAKGRYENRAGGLLPLLAMYNLIHVYHAYDLQNIITCLIVYLGQFTTQANVPTPSVQVLEIVIFFHIYDCIRNPLSLGIIFLLKKPLTKGNVVL